MSLPARFRALFTGYDAVYNKFVAEEVEESGKVSGSSYAVVGTATMDIFKQHLAGSFSLGIIPLTKANGCYFALLDIDNKTKTGPKVVDHKALVTKSAALGLPFVCCKSKSGGAHLYVFFKNQEPAARVREWLKQCASKLGVGNCEIFPKQVSRSSDQDYGNAINLPYHGEKRKAVDEHGNELTLQQFVELAEQRSTELPKVVEKSQNQTDAENQGIFENGPPCLQHIKAEGGFPSGTRNDGMFNVFIYLRKRYGDDWLQHTMDYNVEMCSPPLQTKELSQLEGSHKKKIYAYKCKEPPINSHCDRSTCLKRMYGVGHTEQDRDIVGMTYYRTEGEGDTVHIGFEISGARMFVESDLFFNAAALNKYVWAQCGFLATKLNQSRWQEYIEALALKADIILLPKEIGESGYLYSHIVEFLTQKSQAKTLAEVALAKPYKENGRVFFRIVDLQDHLRIRKVAYGSPQRLNHMLKENGGQDTIRKVGGKTTRLWSLPEVEEVTSEDVEQPKIVEEVF